MGAAHVKVTKVFYDHTFEMTPSDTPVPAHDFWADGLDHVILTSEQKDRLHLQDHRSNDSHGKVLAFAMALQELCNSGISLQHDGKPVVDIWVMNTTEFDISDIPETSILKVRDAPQVRTEGL